MSAYDIEKHRFGNIISTLDLSDKKLIQEAYDFSQKAHQGQKRKSSGEPYFIHPLQVGLDLWDRFGDVELFAAGLLHDTVEDNENITSLMIYELFGGVVGFLVDSVTKNESYFCGDYLAFEDKSDKFLYGGMQDIRCFLLKLADRENNLQTLGSLKNHKQIRIAFETQAIYKPLADILRFHSKTSILRIRRKFARFLVEKNIDDHKELKSELMNTTFHDFTEGKFDFVYHNSSNIVWKIVDKHMYKRFMKEPAFYEKIKIDSIKETQSGEFECLFFYKEGGVFEFHNSKVMMTDSYFI